MDVMDAAHATAHAYPGGTEALALRLGKAAGAFRQELLGLPTHKLGLATAAQMVELSGDHRIIHALCAANGLVAIAVDGVESRGDMLGMLLDQASASGDFAGAIRAALADGVITANELADVADKAMAKIASVQGLLRELRAAHAAGRPAAGREG